MKYIIDLPEEIAKASEEYWKKSTGMVLVPYTESDRKAIEDEVWDFCMNTDWSWISEIDTKPLSGYTYQEAKSRYEEWKKQKDEIRVGDEVKERAGLWTGVVVGFDVFDDLVIMSSSGNSCSGYKAKYFKKTGRHFDEVEELLEKMRGEEE